MSTPSKNVDCIQLCGKKKSDYELLKELAKNEKVRVEINYLKNVATHNKVGSMLRSFPKSKLIRRFMEITPKDRTAMRYEHNPLTFKELGISLKDVIDHLKTKKLV